MKASAILSNPSAGAYRGGQYKRTLRKSATRLALNFHKHIEQIRRARLAAEVRQP